ncbi:isoprenyl transferase [Candidatus Nitrotoga sp. M5]|uniref:isoprenyl transferase n=1 Tax=Candidatus Nitrotoga sp. M5 TaxID=2890409 RepID=UPI001EF2EB37|nr:isoprenyl transferase [Candidatus Nitrotoga sp. M5]CAH1386842.1 ditrans,polycis-undecaprenyl-diphosphate synthase ((2E,6E)-farnesyl-diphosphate specific) [Candidatus Nitrotoga sp. M5]
MALFQSSTRTAPAILQVPRHIAIIMDGNGRWAKQRFLPRIAGHQRGVETVREVVKACRELGVEYLTLFAFSSENWRRPADEVSFLMQLFLKMLQREVSKLHENNIRLKIIGDRSRFDDNLNQCIVDAEQLTADNGSLTLTVAADYGGRWDIMQAMQTMLQKHPDLAGGLNEEDLEAHLAMNYAPEPDLFIRTGGEQRISNFLLWQLAYTELYFTDTLWPAFDGEALKLAIQSYYARERRFGRTSDQVLNERMQDEKK